MTVISYTYKSPKEAFEKIQNKSWTDVFKMTDTLSKILLVAGFILPWMFVLSLPTSSLLAPSLESALNREFMWGIIAQIAMIGTFIGGVIMGKLYTLYEVIQVTQSS